jgi:hypothetical protein
LLFKAKLLVTIRNNIGNQQQSHLDIPGVIVEIKNPDQFGAYVSFNKLLCDIILICTNISQEPTTLINDLRLTTFQEIDQGNINLTGDVYMGGLGNTGDLEGVLFVNLVIVMGAEEGEGAD